MQSTRDVVEELSEKFMMYDSAKTITLEELADMFFLTGTARDHGRWARDHGLNIDLRDLKSARWSMGDITTKILKTGVYGFEIPDSVAKRVKRNVRKETVQPTVSETRSTPTVDKMADVRHISMQQERKAKHDWSSTVAALATLYAVDEERIIEVAVEMFRNTVLSGLVPLDSLGS